MELRPRGSFVRDGERKCKVCGLWLPNDRFSRSYTKSKNDAYDYRCKSCLADRQKERTDSIRQLIAEIKDVPCMDCEGYFPSCVMDFDHRDPTQKNFNISKVLTRSWQSILLEIEKCDIVCANCHRIRTHGCKQLD